MSNLLARSALVDSTFLMLVAFSVTGNKLGVNTIAKLRASILLDSDALETSDKIALGWIMRQHVRGAIRDKPLKRLQFWLRQSIYNT